MTKTSFETIARDLDAECSYLLRRCLIAEGKSLSDHEARAALLAEVQEAVGHARA